MKKTAFFLLITLIYHLAFSQDKDDIIGKWKFIDVYNPTKVDTNTAKIIKKEFGFMFLDFKGNGNYEIVLPKKEMGTWSYNERAKKIILKPINGQTNSIEIVGYINENLIIKFGNASFILENELIEEEE